MNAPELQKIAERLGKVLSISPKEAWDLLDVKFSLESNSPAMDFFLFYEFLKIPDDEEISMEEIIKSRYPNDFDFLCALMF